MVLCTHYRGSGPYRQPRNPGTVLPVSGPEMARQHAEDQTQCRAADAEYPRQAGGSIQQRGSTQQYQHSTQPGRRRSGLPLPAQFPRHGAHKLAHQQRDGHGRNAIGTGYPDHRGDTGDGHCPHNGGENMSFFHQYALHDNKMSIRELLFVLQVYYSMGEVPKSVISASFFITLSLA